MRQRHNHKKGFELLRSNSETIAHKTRMGFGLVEAAIVLGVVGVVIGAIWGVSAKFYEDYKVNKTVEGVFTTARNIQNLISIRDAVIIGDGSDITTTIRDSGAFTKDWVNGGTVKHPFNGSVVIASYGGGVNGERFNIDMYGNFKKSVCVKLVIKFSSMGAMAGSRGGGSWTRPNLGRICVYHDSACVYLTDYPVSLAAAETACTAIATNVSLLSFGFGYTRIN